MTRKPQTMEEPRDKFHEAFLDFVYALVKALGIISFVKRVIRNERLPLDLRDWVKEREAKQ